MPKELVQILTAYFATREDVSLAYLFGSFARGEMHAHSDLDIALYFKTQTGALQYEDTSASWYDQEFKIRSELAHLTKKDIDLVILNRSSASIIFSALRGIELKNIDQAVRSELLGRSMFDAIDFRETVRQYYETAMRS